MKQFVFLITVMVFFVSCDKTYYYVDYKWDEKYTIERGLEHKFKAKNDSDAIEQGGLYLEGLISAQGIVKNSQLIVQSVYLKVDILNSEKRFIGSIYNKETKYEGK